MNKYRNCAQREPAARWRGSALPRGGLQIDNLNFLATEGPGARGRVSYFLDRVSKIFAAFAFLVWLAWVVGFVHWILTSAVAG